MAGNRTETVHALGVQAAHWAEKELLAIETAMLLGALAAALALGYLVARPLVRRLLLHTRRTHGLWRTGYRALALVLTPALGFLFLLLYPPLAETLDSPSRLMPLCFNLLGAWVLIRFASAFIHRRPLARRLAITLWTLAALNAFGLLSLLTVQLDAVGFTVGEKRLSLLLLLQGLAAIALLLWLSQWLAQTSERYISGMERLTPSLRVLLTKIIRIALIIFALLIGLNTLGIDLTSLAVFSGAVGVGIGFGLQKVVSNFISGIILLLDRSIKPGDVIAIDDTYGWVNKLGARHVSVITRDGKEHLIPNELLITERVENWSYSDKNIRLRIPVGIAYHCDPRQALALMLEAAAETRRVLKRPAPVALVTGFGESSIDLELRAWIDDPANGLRNIMSDLLLCIWDKFQANGIQIPFPQRDVHIKSGQI